MALTAQEDRNTLATYFDVRYKYYSISDYTTIEPSDYAVYSLPTGWSACADTIVSASQWTDVSSYVYFSGNWSQDWRESAVTWDANLKGDTFNEAYFGPGKGIMSLACYNLYDDNGPIYGTDLITGVTNGQFSDFTGTADDNTSDDWATISEVNSASSGAITDATVDDYDGDGYAAIIKAGSSGAWLAWGITVVPGITYRLCFYTKGDGTSVSGEYAIYDGTHSAYIVAHTKTDVTGTVWQKICKEFTAPAGCTSVSIRLWAVDSDSVMYVDKVSVYATNSGWGFDWVGIITENDHKDDYRMGGEWSCRVSSFDGLLQRYDSPRIIIGEINALEDASVDVSSTLAVASDESGVKTYNGISYREFAGTQAVVGADNIIDDRLESVWISQNEPSASAVASASPVAIIFDEVFNTPAAGWSRANTWWIEAYMGWPDASLDIAWRDHWIISRNSYGNPAVFAFQLFDGSNGKDFDMGESPYQFTHGERGIICARTSFFEQYTGGDHDAEWVAEAASFPTRNYQYVLPGGKIWGGTACAFDLHPTDGYLVWGEGGPGQATGTRVHDYIAWGNSSASTDLTDIWPLIDWSGSTISVSSLTAGQSIRRQPTLTDTDTAADWVAENAPWPAGYVEQGDREWVRITLKAQDAKVDETDYFPAITESGSVLRLTSTTGWPTSGSGLIEAEEFEYTSRTACTLIMTAPLSQMYLQGTPVFPMSASTAQTGWPLSSISIDRREGLPKIQVGALYTSYFHDTRTPSDASALFVADYAKPLNIGTDGGKQTQVLSTETSSYRWVRTILVTIDKMQDSGRARINRIRATMDQLSVDESGYADLDGSASYYVIKKILIDNTFLDANDIVDKTNSSLPSQLYGRIGDMKIGIERLAQVLNKIAESTGCLVVYTPESQVHIYRDPWWPQTDGYDIWSKADLLPTHVRGPWSFKTNTTEYNGVAVSAKTHDNKLLSREIYPANAVSPLKEITDLVVEEEDARSLAQAMWRKEKSQTTCTLDIKGIGEWCRAKQVVSLAIGPSSLSYGHWVIENVRRQWSSNEKRREFKTTVTLRRFVLA